MSAPKAAGAEPAPGARLQVDPRYLSSGLITLILVLGQMYVGFLHGLTQLITAISVALLAELTLGRLLTGRWINPASAYITGISCGILLRSLYLWPFAIASLLSIISKYVLRYRGKHLWNPSNLGICVVLFSAPGDRGRPQRTVGERSVGHGRDLGAGVGDPLARETVPRHLYLRGILCRTRLRSIDDDRQPLPLRSSAHHGAHVPVDGVLHGHGSRHLSLLAPRPDRGRIPRGTGGDGVAAVRNRERAAVRLVSCGTDC